VHRFIETEAAAGIVLVAVTAAALVWANSPFQHSYKTLWHNTIVLQLGSLRVAEDLRHFVNDGLMALFFFVVALEVKRELVRGELADLRVAALPVFAAVGGMVVPASVYLLVTAGTGAGHGWGIPMATDIAFALGVLALLSRRLPGSLKVLLLTLAIVDDIGAIVVIAVFYGGDFDVTALAVAAALLGVTAVLVRARMVQSKAPLSTTVTYADKMPSSCKVWAITSRICLPNCFSTVLCNSITISFSSYGATVTIASLDSNVPATAGFTIFIGYTLPFARLTYSNWLKYLSILTFPCKYKWFSLYVKRIAHGKTIL
jgi:hypothetical protein